MICKNNCICGELTPTANFVVDAVTHPALHALFCAQDKIPVSAPEFESTGHAVPASWMPLCCVAETALEQFTVAEIDLLLQADSDDDDFFALMNRTPASMVAGLVAYAYQADWEMPHD